MSSLDLTALRVLKYRDKYEALARAVPQRVLHAQSLVLFRAFRRFFDQFPDAQRIDRGAFELFLRSTVPNMPDDDFAVYKAYLKKIDEDVDPSLEAGIMRRLVEAATACDIADLLEKYNAGEEVDLRNGLTSFLEVYDTQLSKNVKNPQVLDKIEDLMAEEDDDRGLHWRWSCLNRVMRPIRGGDFVVIAGRPDRGKSTALTDNLTHMAAQVDMVWPDEKRSILWLNNEGPGKRIVTRAFQSALNVTREELVALVKEPADPEFAKYGNKARQLYAQALGGRPGVLRIFDIHDWWSHEVEDLIKKYNPALLVMDMVDNIRFSGGAANGGERTDQLLEAMYQWARVRGVKYDCGVIATSQISADGDGITYPTLGQLKDSKTGKQGAADAIITIGASNDASLENSRFIGTTKNKLRRTGAPASPRTEMIFDGARGRYLEPTT